ncbi:hypothetical protein PJ250_07635 [Pseudoxanthomonas sp. JBR18]|nr:hypothetical protein [Pseudoxanthomonas sp. JBR18]WCE05808.1 hypothetical protein PJ250_07635 [Pseudoxanthomonas sp. JBR18]
MGETEVAARGTSSLSLKERNDSANLLLLCRDHHKIVDDSPVTYPVEVLHELKEEHLAWVASSLLKPRAWRSNISQLTYINVPRLCEQAEMCGYHVDLSSYKNNQTLHSLGWELNRVMAAFQAVLSHLSIDAIPVRDLILHEAAVGAAISFDRQRVRTKNVPMDVLNDPSKLRKFTGSLTKDPHIYCQLGDFKLVMLIDPRWITTSTAFTLFRPSSGQSVFAGIGRVTGVDYETRIVTATPWVLGLPHSPLEDAIKESAASRSALVAPSASLDSLVDLARGKKNKLYFSSPPTQCDLCQRSLATDKYMIDGAVKDLGGAWACMCADCFNKRGQRIGWGYGQLYLRDDIGWLEVAGFRPP